MDEWYLEQLLAMSEELDKWLAKQRRGFSRVLTAYLKEQK